MLNYAIIGFGGLGKSHFNNTAELLGKVGDINLVALCDIDEKAFSTQTEINLGTNEVSLDLSKYNLYSDPAELLEKEQLDFIITAIPTYVHEKVAVMAMEKGIHVFSEKPMAISLEQAQNMLDVSKKNNVKLMIGQCLRYWPEYVILKDMIDSKKYGNVIYARFNRMSGTPRWSWENWMCDASKSGGAALDMHVHDVDFINWAFGMPNAVTSRATSVDVEHDSIVTAYDYDDFFVTSACTWGVTDTYPFTAEFLVRFENGTVEMKNGKLLEYTNSAIIETPVVASNAYVNELVDFIDCIRTGREIEINHPESSMQSLRLAIAEKKSSDEKETIKF